MARWPAKRSIAARMVAAFAAMSLIILALGSYGIYVLTAAGGLVVDTYDRPLMAINFARAASLTFTRMDKEVLRRNLVPAAEQPDLDRNLDELTASFFEDLGVAEQRSLASDERAAIADIKDRVAQWSAVRKAAEPGAERRLDALAEAIVERFDRLIELVADHSFVERRKAVWSISYFRYMSIAASLLALLVSAAITILLTRRILQPLSAAASVADRIAAGELDAPIPGGGSDETGILLRSMQVMQDNIRVMVERETAQRRLAQIRLIDALESSREGMVLVDPKGAIIIANSQVAAFFPAVAPYLVEGTEFAAAFDRIRPQLVEQGGLDDAARVAQERSHLASAAGSIAYVGEYLTTDARWIRFSRSDTQDGGFILFLSDFTEIKQREEHFKEAKRQAEAANAAKSSFLAQMSHELRTPLNAIIGFSELIAIELLGPVGNRQYVDYAGNIGQSAHHLLEVINSVLDLAQSEAGKQQIRPEVLDLRAILDDCATMMGDQMARAGLSFAVTRPDEPLPVLGDPPKLRQIFLNLLSNAVKFTDVGGTVSLSARATETRVVVDVADTGIGMRSDDIPIALAPFGQIDSRIARRYAGTGLGLPLTAALVDLHGGELAIDSSLGEGTCVTVSLARFGADAAVYGASFTSRSRSTPSG